MRSATSVYSPTMYVFIASSARCCAGVFTCESAVRTSVGKPRIISSGSCGAIAASSSACPSAAAASSSSTAAASCACASRPAAKRRHEGAALLAELAGERRLGRRTPSRAPARSARR